MYASKVEEEEGGRRGQERKWERRGRETIRKRLLTPLVQGPAYCPHAHKKSLRAGVEGDVIVN